MTSPIAKGADYSREEIAVYFSGEMNPGLWHQGMVPVDGAMVLLSTGDRAYDDILRRGGKSMAWQSQNRTKRASKQGQILLAASAGCDSVPVYLFHRATAKTKGKATRFQFLGRVECASATGECPINIVWRIVE